jgi:hypothetical protein
MFQFRCRVQQFSTWYQSEVGKLIASESQRARDCQQDSIVGEAPGSFRSDPAGMMTSRPLRVACRVTLATSLIWHEQEKNDDGEHDRRFAAGLEARARPARRSGHEKSSHHGSQKRALACASRRVGRKNGGFWSAQFCTEMARPKRFELLTPRFVV